MEQGKRQAITLLDLYYVGKVVALSALFISFSFCWAVFCITAATPSTETSLNVMVGVFCLFFLLACMLLRDRMVVVYEGGAPPSLNPPV